MPDSYDRRPFRSSVHSSRSGALRRIRKHVERPYCCAVTPSVVHQYWSNFDNLSPHRLALGCDASPASPPPILARLANELHLGAVLMTALVYAWALFRKRSRRTNTTP